MLRTRVIPVLLLRGQGLYKTIRFKNPQYVGDPINAIKIFNEKEVDELILLDIDASKKGEEPNYKMIQSFCSECFMPVCYGGGITSVLQMRRIFELGIEKIAVNTSSLKDLRLIAEASADFGSQSIIASVDVVKDFWGQYHVYNHVTGKKEKVKLKDYINQMQQAGAGELFLNSVDKDGTLSGYDTNLLQQVVSYCSLPIVACGGAASVDDFVAAKKIGISGCAAGSMFVFHGRHRAVLITYPTSDLLTTKLHN